MFFLTVFALLLPFLYIFIVTFIKASKLSSLHPSTLLPYCRGLLLPYIASSVIAVFIGHPFRNFPDGKPGQLTALVFMELWQKVGMVLLIVGFIGFVLGIATSIVRESVDNMRKKTK